MRKNYNRFALFLVVSMLACVTSVQASATYEVRFPAKGPLGPHTDAPAPPSESPRATSCQALLQMDPGKSSGWHDLTVNGVTASYYCDMDSDGGGWTRVVRQLEASPVVDWNGGVNGASYALAQSQIPAHSEVAFGRDEIATFIDYVTWTYSSGDIPRILVTSPKSGEQYFIHRDSVWTYIDLDPRGNAFEGPIFSGVWHSSLALISVSSGYESSSYGWGFAPANGLLQYRGYRMGPPAYALPDSYAWTVWVR